MLGARDRAETLPGLETTRGMFAGEQARDDAMLRADARRDHAADVVGAARPALGTIVGVKFVGPYLLAGAAVHEPDGEQWRARGIAGHAVQFEACGIHQ